MCLAEQAEEPLLALADPHDSVAKYIWCLISFHLLIQYLFSVPVLVIMLPQSQTISSAVFSASQAASGNADRFASVPVIQHGTIQIRCPTRNL